MRAKRRDEYIKDVLAAEPIEADFMVGLTAEEVDRRRKEGFANKTKKKVTKSYGQIFFDNVFTFFNLVYFAVAAAMFAARLDVTYFFFLIPVIGNILIGLGADIHARRLVDSLRLLTDPKVRVMRDRKVALLAPNEVVLSDIMVLEPGDQVCLDGVVVNGRAEADESSITGESAAVPKGIGSPMLSGSYIKSGKAYVRVTRIGIANYAEGLQDEAKRFERPQSELKQAFFRIFVATGVSAIVIGVGELITWLAAPPPDMPLDFNGYAAFVRSFSGSLVAMIPAGLYLLTSITLAVGVINLAKKRMNVQELYCIEMLARVDVLCFDKTGTLTDGRLAVKDFYNFSDQTDAYLQGFIGTAVLASGDDNATAKALKQAFPGNGSKAKAFIPFDSVRKFSAASFEGDGTFLIGAPDAINASIPPMAADRRRRLAERGYRVLGVFHSTKSIKNGEIPGKADLVALISLSDHLKSDAKTNIAWFRENGVGVKVISGDDPITVSEIANEAGVPGASNYVSLAGISDEETAALALKNTVFGRATPTQKAIIIKELQRQRHKVAMAGDGVNDILALKAADCSIAMASGSSAARNVSHLISLDDDFSRLPDVVAEGRRVVNNLERTASLFLSKSLFAIVMSLVFLLVSWVHGRLIPYPYLTKNMYLWEIVSIGFGGFFLALQPTNERLAGDFISNVWAQALSAGLAEIISAGAVFILSFCFPDFLSEDAAVSLSVVIFSAVSYIVLLKISLPFDRYRAFVYGGLVLLGLALAGLDVFLFYHDAAFNPQKLIPGLLGIDYGALNVWHWLLGVLIVALIGSLYFPLSSVCVKALNRLANNKKEARPA
jgi:cation-transporting ATPase E